MSKYRNSLPQLEEKIYLAYAGMETDLIFNHGIDLPGFAGYKLLESEDGQQRFYSYCQKLVSLSKKFNYGVILESPTWVGNRDRGAEIGNLPQKLASLNRLGVEMISQARDEFGDLPTVLSCSVGPRDDGYNPTNFMTALEAEQYHSEQINWVVDTNVDMINAVTLSYPEEAIGIINASRKVNLPCAIGFTVETNGHLSNGESVEAAIEKTDKATAQGASYYIINCAHPDHFSDVLNQNPWMNRLRGVIVNASRCSHAELDESEILDDGDLNELGQQVANINSNHPQVTVLGGCCGTDLRHMEEIAMSSQKGKTEF